MHPTSSYQRLAITFLPNSQIVACTSLISRSGEGPIVLATPSKCAPNSWQNVPLILEQSVPLLSAFSAVTQRQLLTMLPQPIDVPSPPREISLSFIDLPCSKIVHTNMPPKLSALVGFLQQTKHPQRHRFSPSNLCLGRHGWDRKPTFTDLLHYRH